MTTYGPCKRFTIRTLDSIITITGNNMIATVTGFDGGGFPQDASVRSHNGSSLYGESSSTEEHQLELASSDMESVSHTPVREEIPGPQCPSDIIPVTHETTVDSDSSKPNDIGSTIDKCGSLTDLHNQGLTAPYSSISISSDSNSDSDRESQLCEASSDLRNKRKCSDRELLETGDSDEREQSLMIRKRIRSSVSGAIGNHSSNLHSSKSEMRLQSSKGKKCSPKKTVKRLTHDKTFTTSKNLSELVHIHTDSGEKPSTCTICGKTFTKSTIFSRHVRTHTAEKPYSCDICGKTFTRSENLTVHTRIHTGERPFSCATCGKTFTQSWGLSQHSRIHTGVKPYSCDTCGKTFTQSGNYSLHVRTHTGEKPYSCDTCGKTFAGSWGLSLHARTHAREKPYSCNICGKTFTQSGNLAAHTRIHTSRR